MRRQPLNASIGAGRARRARGFTLVELLVVIAIVGLLLALLLPAVQAAREAGRRAACTNHLKQLGVALQSFHDSKKVLPKGGVVQYLPNFGARVEGGGSLLMFLLPYIEEQSLYSNYDFSLTDATVVTPAYVDLQTFAGSTRQLRTAQIEIYLCPSDEPPLPAPTSGGFPVGLFNYAGSSGSRAPSVTGNVNPAGPCPCSQTFPNPFAPDSATFGLGPFQRYHYLPPAAPSTTKTVRLKDVSDGLSKTIFMGEDRQACSTHASTGWGSSDNLNGLATTLVALNQDTCQNSDPDGCNRPCNQNISLGFKSAHPGGVQFLLGDGAVRFVADEVDFQTLQLLGGKADGRIVSLSE